MIGRRRLRPAGHVQDRVGRGPGCEDQVVSVVPPEPSGPSGFRVRPALRTACGFLFAPPGAAVDPRLEQTRELGSIAVPHHEHPLHSLEPLPKTAAASPWRAPCFISVKYSVAGIRSRGGIDCWAASMTCVPRSSSRAPRRVSVRSLEAAVFFQAAAWASSPSNSQQAARSCPGMYRVEWLRRSR